MNPITRNDKSAADVSADTRIDHVAERAKQGVSNAVSGARDRIDTAADRTEEGLHHAADAGAHGAHRVAELASATRDQATRASERLCELVRNKPIETVAIALAAGWLVGRLLKPRG